MLKGVHRLPIRWQITLWFSGLLAAVLLFFGLSLYLTLQTDLLTRIDESLKRRATEVRVRLEGIAQAANLNSQQVTEALEINPLDEFADPGVYVQVLDPQGKVLGDSTILGQARLPIDPALVVVALNGQPTHPVRRQQHPAPHATIRAGAADHAATLRDNRLASSKIRPPSARTGYLATAPASAP